MTKYSMKSLKRKNHQRWVNKACRYINKVMEDDDLWLGRFYVSQNCSHMEWFNDKSGGLIYVYLTMHDRKTGITRSKWYSGLDFNWEIWRDLNDFIIIDCKVWEEEPDIRINRIDYRKGKNNVL